MFVQNSCSPFLRHGTEYVPLLALLQLFHEGQLQPRDLRPPLDALFPGKMRGVPKGRFAVCSTRRLLVLKLYYELLQKEGDFEKARQIAVPLNFLDACHHVQDPPSFQVHVRGWHLREPLPHAKPSYPADSSQEASVPFKVYVGKYMGKRPKQPRRIKTAAPARSPKHDEAHRGSFFDVLRQDDDPFTDETEDEDEISLSYDDAAKANQSSSKEQGNANIRDRLARSRLTSENPEISLPLRLAIILAIWNFIIGNTDHELREARKLHLNDNSGVTLQNYLRTLSRSTLREMSTRRATDNNILIALMRRLMLPLQTGKDDHEKIGMIAPEIVDAARPYFDFMTHHLRTVQEVHEYFKVRNDEFFEQNARMLAELEHIESEANDETALSKRLAKLSFDPGDSMSREYVRRKAKRRSSKK